jgi:hypothetical protein
MLLAMVEPDLGQARARLLARLLVAAPRGRTTLSTALVRDSRLKFWNTKPIFSLR